MDTPSSQTTDTALAVMTAALDGVDHAERRPLDHRARLALVEQARVVLARTEALLGVLVAEADRARSSTMVAGTPTTTWLQSKTMLGRGEAVGLVMGGRDVNARPCLRDAALTGRVSTRQARSIAKVVAQLPAGLTPRQRDRAEEWLIAEAAHADAGHLAKLGSRVLDEVAPEAAETPEQLQSRLEAQQRRAQAARCLTFTDDGDGSYLVHGSLPHLQATPLMKILQAKVDAGRRHARDLPRSERPLLSLGQRWADALLDLAAGVAQRAPAAVVGGTEPRRGDGRCSPTAATIAPTPAASAAAPSPAPSGGVPTVAGERPRIVVTFDHDTLRRRVEQAGLLDTGQIISAGDLRRLACDADLVPVVLGGGSELLDYGTTVRLVPAALRRALSLRDGCCTFPGCEAPDTQCDAHHIIPWWNRGATSLANLVLLCPHHHAMVEPPRFWSGPPPDRWQVRLNARGHPEFIPPRSIDPAQVPRTNRVTREA